MQVNNTNLLSPSLGRAMTDLRTTFDQLNLELSSGKVADTYGGLGTGRSVSLAARASLTQMQGFQDNVTTVNLRVSTMTTVLGQLGSLASDQRSDTDPTDNTVITANGQTRAQGDAKSRLDEALSALNTDINGRYLFSGNDTSQSPVLTSDQILNGDSGKSGLIDVIAERRAADIGTVGTDASGNATVGRLVVAPSTGTDFTIAEDAAQPFGMKLAGGNTNMTGTTISTPTTPAPASMDIAMTAQPTEGQTVNLSFNLPDGTTSSITLTATANPTGSGQFQIGSDVATTLNNLRTAVVSNLNTAAQTDLAAASSVVASNSFFAAGANTPPQRVDFTPPATAATATALRSGAADTVTWYQGGDSPNASSSASAQIDQGVTVNYGSQANEKGIASVISSLAMLAAQTYPTTNLTATGELQGTDAGLNTALSTRARDALQPNSGVDSVEGITTRLASASNLASDVSDRLTTAQNTTQDMIDGVESADTQTVAAQILSIQTRLTATYQTTSMLAHMSLVNYLTS